MADRCKIPIGYGIKLFVDFLNTYFSWLFDGISFVLGGAIDAVVEALQWLPAPVLILLDRRARLVAAPLLEAGAADRPGPAADHQPGLLEGDHRDAGPGGGCRRHLMAIGVPIGIAAAHRPRLYAAMRPVLDMMQTIPTFVYLIPTLILFGLGVVPGLISTIIFAVAGADQADPVRRRQRAAAAARGGHRLRRHAAASCCGRSSCRMPCRPSWRG